MSCGKVRKSSTSPDHLTLSAKDHHTLSGIARPSIFKSIAYERRRMCPDRVVRDGGGTHISKAGCGAPEFVVGRQMWATRQVSHEMGKSAPQTWLDSKRNSRCGSKRRESSGCQQHQSLQWRYPVHQSKFRKIGRCRQRDGGGYPCRWSWLQILRQARSTCVS